MNAYAFECEPIPTMADARDIALDLGLRNTQYRYRATNQDNLNVIEVRDQQGHIVGYL